MMMGDKKPSIASIIIRSIGDKQKAYNAPKDEKGDELNNELAKKSAVNSIFKAIQANDQQMFLISLQSLIQMCCAEMDEVDEEES